MLTRNGLYLALVTLCQKHEAFSSGVQSLTKKVGSKTYLTENAVDYLLCVI